MKLSRASGILLHPTSLPGADGSGDFGAAAYHFVDWLSTAGQSYWQVLPLSPIGPGNSPYQSVSAFAIDPLLIGLDDLRSRGWLDARIEGGASEARHIDYPRVIAERMAALQRAAQAFFARSGAAEQESFAAFCHQEAEWLDDYALFMALDARFHGRPWTRWPPELAARDPAALAAARSAETATVRFWKFTQWLADTQWQTLRAHAAARGVSIIGDLPIFVAHHSADCWARPDLYWLDDTGLPLVVAGVPPDFFSATGQRWGNPLYRWERMREEGYAWWIQRMRRQLETADRVRVDHFRGFAAYWEIPAEETTATRGRWVPGPGRAVFDAIKAALGDLPIIAEDLGLITPDVAALRDALGLPGMRVLQFAFAGDAEHPFLPHNYPTHTVAFTGTHDNDTARGWWASCSERERRFAAAYLDGAASEIHWAMIRAVLQSVATLAIIPFQDVLGLDGAHRMNTPGQTGCWTWRFCWDEVSAEPALRLLELSATSGRCAFDRWRSTSFHS